MKHNTQTLLALPDNRTITAFVVRQHRYWKTDITNSAKWDGTLELSNMDIYKASYITFDDATTAMFERKPHKDIIAFTTELEAIDYIKAKLHKRMNYDIQRLSTLSKRSWEIYSEKHNKEGTHDEQD